MADIIIGRNNDHNMREQLSTVLTDHDDRIASLEGDIIAANYANVYLQNVVATEGGTVVVGNQALRDVTLVISAAGDLTDFTIEFPADSDSRNGQVVRLAFFINIANLTLGSSVDPLTFYNPIVTAASGDCYSFHRIAVGSWVRLI